MMKGVKACLLLACAYKCACAFVWYVGVQFTRIFLRYSSLGIPRRGLSWRLFVLLCPSELEREIVPEFMHGAEWSRHTQTQTQTQTQTHTHRHTDTHTQTHTLVRHTHFESPCTALDATMSCAAALTGTNSPSKRVSLNRALSFTRRQLDGACWRWFFLLHSFSLFCTHADSCTYASTCAFVRVCMCVFVSSFLRLSVCSNIGLVSIQVRACVCCVCCVLVVVCSVGCAVVCCVLLVFMRLF